MSSDDETAPANERSTPRRIGKKGTFQSLTAAEYAAKHGASLYVKASNSTKASPRDSKGSLNRATGEDPQ